MGNDLSPRTASRSLTTMTEFILPTHTNALGGVFGGQIMAWMDLCAAICAQRHTGQLVTTAGIDDLSFDRPIKVGQVAQIRARVTAAFKSSVEIAVQVDGEDAPTGERWPCVSAYLTFVAVDAAGKPTLVPPLLAESDADREHAEAAAERRALRLARRKKVAI